MVEVVDIGMDTTVTMMMMLLHLLLRLDCYLYLNSIHLVGNYMVDLGTDLGFVEFVVLAGLVVGMCIVEGTHHLLLHTLDSNYLIQSVSD